MIIEVFYNIFTSKNHALIRSLDMVIILGLVRDKWDAQKLLNRTWLPPTELDKGTKDILLGMKNPTVNTLGEIKVDINRDSFRSNLRRSRDNKASYISGLRFIHYNLSARSALLLQINTIYCHIYGT